MNQAQHQYELQQPLHMELQSNFKDMVEIIFWLSSHYGGTDNEV